MDLLMPYHDAFNIVHQQIENWKEADRSIDRDIPGYNLDNLKMCLDHAVHTKYDEMIFGIKSVLETLLDNNREYYLFFPTGESQIFKTGSENLIILECFDQLVKSNKIISVLMREEDVSSCPAQSNILLIDDCIYTGTNLFSIIRHLSSYNKDFNYTSVTYGISSEITESYIEEKCDIQPNQITVKSHIQVEPIIHVILKSMLKGKSLDTDFDTLKSTPNYRSCVDAFGGPGTGDKIPLIYFDHKIHPTVYPLFENSYFRYPPSRYPVYIIEDIIEKLST